MSRTSHPHLLAMAVLMTLGLGAAVADASSPSAADGFVNWESAHVSPLAMTPGRAALLAVNTADARLEVFDLSDAGPVHRGAVPVGLEPVSVRARNDTEAWVVNHVSDSISIVDLASMAVIETIQTLDEPADVVFAGDPLRAFISCSQANTVMVVDPERPKAAAVLLPVGAEDPRSMAVSADGTEVYVAIFHSGNGTTALRGRLVVNGSEVTPINHPDGPYGGQNPPPNDGSGFKPAIRAEYLPGGAQQAPEVSLIVRKNGDRWFDDNGSDWTDFVRGPRAGVGLRPAGWDLADRDVAVIDTATLGVTWIENLMTTDAALAVNPQSGSLLVVGTEADNVTRFEPNIKAKFVKAVLAHVPTAGPPVLHDLNRGHLDYSPGQISTQSNPSTADPALREMSIGEPRGVAWTEDGTRGYVTGLGSNNVIVVDDGGDRLTAAPIDVGAGPTGVVVDDARSFIYVLNRFDASLSVIERATNRRVGTLDFFDPTPAVIRDGRPFLYDTHLTSGLGQVSCASCHIDTRMDRLAWDLGDPTGPVEAVNGVPGQHNAGMGVPGLDTGFRDFHPMKGPMVTQTLIDIVGKEPLHWRGDRDGLEEFNAAFMSLQGDDEVLTAADMQKLEDFLATLHFPPNPFRNLDNSLPTEVHLPDQFSDGRFAGQGGLSAGQPMPAGDARRGLALFRPPNITAFAGLACSSCHTMPTGAGTDHSVNAGQTAFEPIPRGPRGENHLAIFAEDGTVESTIKAPQLRNLHEKTGFDTTSLISHQGFGYEHDGVTDTLTRFHMHPTFFLPDDQAVSDVVAFMFAFSGSDLPQGSTDYGPFLIFEPPGPPSQDTHAAVGRQLTVNSTNRNDAEVLEALAQLTALADTAAVGLVAKASLDGLARGFVYLGSGALQADRAAENAGLEEVINSLAPGDSVTLTAVPTGTELRLGVDRDRDGAYDRDELDACSDPADPSAVPTPSVVCPLFLDGFESGDTRAWTSTLGGPATPRNPPGS
ncbi:MAG: hypothetical protein AAGM22_19900 [Acidobacteriota bacterium]